MTLPKMKKSWSLSRRVDPASAADVYDWFQKIANPIPEFEPEPTREDEGWDGGLLAQLIGPTYTEGSSPYAMCLCGATRGDHLFADSSCPETGCYEFHPLNNNRTFINALGQFVEVFNGKVFIEGKLIGEWDPDTKARSMQTTITPNGDVVTKLGGDTYINGVLQPF